MNYDESKRLYFHEATVEHLEETLKYIPHMSPPALNFLLEWVDGKEAWLIEYDLENAYGRSYHLTSRKAG